jgi:hypothetical protein
MGQSGQEIVLTMIGFSESLLSNMTIGDVFDREQDHFVTARLAEEPPRVQQHRFLTYLREAVRYFEISYRALLGNHRVEQFPEVRTVPLAFAKFIEVESQGLLWLNLKCLVKSQVGFDDHEIAIEYQKRLSDRFHNCVKKCARASKLPINRVQLGIPSTQFLVSNGELLVGRLQLLLGGLKFLVGAEEFLVYGKRLLMGGFHFLPGGFMFFDDRLQINTGRVEFTPKARYLALFFS